MPEKLKDVFFADTFITRLGDVLQRTYLSFDRDRFTALLYTSDWADIALKAKMRHCTQSLHAALPQDYAEAIAILRRVAPSFDGFEGMVFSDYVECYGQDHWEVSISALNRFTRYGSAEFAIRPFIVQDTERTMAVMHDWAMDDNHHVRRLASEGCRPRLPWAMALPAFKADPSPILPVLERLKNDASDYVRRSVANNLNDISKDHPDRVLDVCERWYGHTKNTDWIVKHACRSLLKAGNRRALTLFGFGAPSQLHIRQLRLDRERLSIGEEFRFHFDLIQDAAASVHVRLEYGVDYVKAKGRISRKVFHLQEKHLEPGTHTFTRKHSFKDRSTRKHYAGMHRLSVVVNGVEKAAVSFLLQ